MAHPEICKVSEAACLLGVSEPTVYRLIANGKIKHAARIGRGLRINARAEWPELFGREDADGGKK